MSRDWEDEFGKGIAALFVVALIIGAFLTAKAVELVLRVMVKYPQHCFMWVLLGLWAITLVVLIVVANQPKATPDAALVGFSLSTASLLLAAKGVEIYHEERFEREITKEVVIDDVLRRPWFSL
jgi:hypothetical protein